MVTHNDNRLELEARVDEALETLAKSEMTRDDIESAYNNGMYALDGHFEQATIDVERNIKTLDILLEKLNENEER